MLTPLQKQIAHAVFASTPDSELALAGGAALISLGLVERATIDLDFFTTTPRVGEVVEAIVPALEGEGLNVRTERAEDTFVRLVVTGGSESCQVDVAQDFRLRPAVAGSLGPTLTAEELAADKMLALSSRAEPRDYVDVFFLALRFERQRLLEVAKEKDLGFDEAVFGQMLAAIERLDREEFTVDDATLEELQRFFAEWREQLPGP